MFLKELTIQNADTLIREISFKKGVNFIVDETPKGYSAQSTGNNVGKTTVLRLIDYCLGSRGTSIYKDTEFTKQPNTKVENFLKENNILITLVLADNLDDPHTEELVIQRNFLKYKQKIQTINGEPITGDKEFRKALKKYIFKSSVDKPTFRQIISKNIRDEENRLKNIVKVLFPRTSGEVYEALYLFWLGLEFENIDRKHQLIEEQKTEKSLQKRLTAENSASLIEQTLNLVNKKLVELNQKKEAFNLNEHYDKDLERLNDVKIQINRLSTELGRLEIRRELIEESREDLEREYSKLDALQVKNLYQKAQALIPDIQVSFEDTVRFHNEMVQEKIDYITKELPQIVTEIRDLKEQIREALENEKRLTVLIQKSGVAADLEDIVRELNRESEKKGRLEEQKHLWDTSSQKLETIEKELEDINKGIDEKDTLIRERITQFNNFFADMSYQLYGEYYLLSSKKNKKGYELIVTNEEGNPSTGKKKGQIAAFDFAYLQFAELLNLEYLHFILHDQLENMHDNQLTTLVQIANSMNGQYIVPILRDKIPAHMDISEMERLSLSQNDKLFRLS